MNEHIAAVVFEDVGMSVGPWVFIIIIIIIIIIIGLLVVLKILRHWCKCGRGCYWTI